MQSMKFASCNYFVGSVLVLPPWFDKKLSPIWGAFREIPGHIVVPLSKRPKSKSS